MFVVLSYIAKIYHASTSTYDFTYGFIISHYETTGTITNIKDFCWEGETEAPSTLLNVY